MSELRAYSGGCHCGRVRYEVRLDLEAPAVTCNCSICSKTGTMLMFVPVSQFTLRAGEDAMTDYLFNHHVIHHLFCSTCGIRSFAKGVDPQGNEVRAVNVRCLDDIDVDKITAQQFDGKSR